MDELGVDKEKIFIQSSGLKIEALVENTEREQAVVVTHPHPLFGGDMYNNVVESVVRSYRAEGYGTLRFNFRGVGLSGGKYDNGVGEQDDVGAALEYLHGLGKTQVDLAGYSFGAWVNALGLDKFVHAKRMIMISPPVNFVDFSFLEYSPKIKLVISGSDDDIGPPAIIKKMLSRWNPEVEFRVIPGSDHFYFGRTGELGEIIQDFLSHEGLGPEGLL